MVSAIDATGYLKLNDGADHFLGLRANPAMGANLSYTFPSADGSAGQVLTTNGAGTFTWSSGGASSVRIDGTTPLTGPWNVGSQDLSSVGNMALAAAKT